MKKLLLVFSIVITILFSFYLVISPVYSDELDDINKKLADLGQALSASQKATAPLESQLTSLRNQLTGIENRISFIETDIVNKKKLINTGYQELEKQKEVFNRAVRNYYIESYSFSPLLVFISSNDAADVTRNLAYRKKGQDQDKALITSIALKVSDLEQRKVNLEDEEKRLSSVKGKLAVEKAEIEKVVKGAKAYQASLSTEIAQLSAKQQDLLAAKLGSLGLPTSAYTTKGGCSSDLTNGKDPGFSPRIAFFTYGVPHRVGMSQYGAKGRADSGQSYNDILSFYFPSTQLSTVATSTNIHVTGTNEYGQSFDDNWSIEDYVKHVYEMPTNWNSNALKAQAVAARSYALAVTNSGSSTICPSQSCQVVKKELNSDSWVQAVNDTAGQVLTSGGSPIQAWFSSTAGGYTFGSGDVWGGSNKPWTRNSLDATGAVASFSDLQNNAYDKSSPWFYCDWGARSAYSGTAWLKPDEVADIVNVLLLAKNDSSTQKHLSQVDKPNPDGVDTWDADRVKQELKGRGITPLNSVSNVSVNADFGSGRTTTVSVSGDTGSPSFSGADFKNYFNLRAPANINIVGPLYNAEKQ